LNLSIIFSFNIPLYRLKIAEKILLFLIALANTCKIPLVFVLSTKTKSEEDSAILMKNNFRTEVIDAYES
jgi:hypothetical protein